MRDCNTCLYHQQGKHPAFVAPCSTCLGLDLGDVPLALNALPYWEPMETSPHTIVSDHENMQAPALLELDPTHTGEVVNTDEIDPPLLPTDAKARKGIPIATGVLDYFPAALAEVARLSKAGNDQHNPGQPLHWSRGKSNDHADTMQRHFLERGTVDIDGMLHSAKMVWRALALLQCELEAEGAPLARGARVDA